MCASNMSEGGGTTLRTVFCTPVTVNNVVSNQQASNQPHGGRQLDRAGTRVPKLCIRVVSKTKKKDAKTFILRDVGEENFSSIMELKKTIKKQLGGDVVDSDFEVGMVEGSSVINIRTQDDVKEFWLEAKKGGKVMLWCDALKDSNQKSNKRATFDDSDSEDDHRCSKSKKRRVTGRDKEDKVQETIEALKEKHGESTYTIMQLRIWSEMIQSGMHSSYTDPPKNSMFQRAGGKDTPKRKSSETMAEIAAHVASQAVASTLTPKAGSSAGTSPGRVIESRSKCYRQLSELNNLKASGVLSFEEYQAEKKQ